MGGLREEGIGSCRWMGNTREWSGVRRDGRRAVMGHGRLIRDGGQPRRNGLYVRTSSLDLSIPIKQIRKPVDGVRSLSSLSLKTV
jgi:hypothetical protein